MGVFGDTLRQARTQKGVTLKEVEQAIRINRHHLAALEDENFGVLPVGLVYQRGSVRNYATFLDLDPGKLLPMFEEARGGDSSVEWVTQVKPLDMPNHWTPNFAIIAFMVVMSAIVFTWVYSISFNNPVVSATLPPVIPTVTPIPDNQLALAEPTAVPPTPLVTSDQALAPAVNQVTAFQPQAATPPAARSIAAVPTATSVTTPLPTVAPAPTESAQEPPAAAAGGTTIRVVAVGDIQVTILADGNPVFSGWLGAGSSTDWFTAGTFDVTTSDGSQTLFENANNTGTQFFMGYGLNETYQLAN